MTGGVDPGGNESFGRLFLELPLEKTSSPAIPPKTRFSAEADGALATDKPFILRGNQVPDSVTVLHQENPQENAMPTTGVDYARAKTK